MDENKEYRKHSGVYNRYFEERKVMLTDVYTNIEMLDPKKIVSEVSKIYRHAQSKGMFPILPAGQILHIDKHSQLKFCFFLEILNCGEDEDRVFTLPSGNSQCIQVELEPSMDLLQTIEKHWEDVGGKTIIVNNVMLEKYSFENHPSELQKVEFTNIVW